MKSLKLIKKLFLSQKEVLQNMNIQNEILLVGTLLKLVELMYFLRNVLLFMELL